MDAQTEQLNGYQDFEFQKWPVYQKALAFVSDAYHLCAELPKDSATGLRDQLRRASQSIPLNIAESTSRYGEREKTNFLRIAKGSTFECVAVLDLVRTMDLVKRDLGTLYKDLATIGRMLSGLIRYLEKEAKKGKP